MPAHHARLPRWEDRSPDQKIDALHRVIQNMFGFMCYPAMRHLDELLARHVPFDEHEVRSIVLIRQMAAEHPDIFSPTCEPGHITGSALVVHPESNRVLLTFHRKLKRWLQMGGHSDFELDPAAIAMREAREESGLADLQFYSTPKHRTTVNGFLAVHPLDIDAHLIPARPDTPEHYHLDIRYLVVTGEPEQIQMDERESNDLRWFDMDALGEVDTDDSVMRLVRKAKTLLAAQLE